MSERKAESVIDRLPLVGSHAHKYHDQLHVGRVIPNDPNNPNSIESFAAMVPLNELQRSVWLYKIADQHLRDHRDDLDERELQRVEQFRDEMRKRVEYVYAHRDQILPANFRKEDFLSIEHTNPKFKHLNQTPPTLASIQEAEEKGDGMVDDEVSMDTSAKRMRTQ